jgi:hypothetical protein
MTTSYFLVPETGLSIPYFLDAGARSKDTLIRLRIGRGFRVGFVESGYQKTSKGKHSKGMKKARPGAGLLGMAFMTRISMGTGNFYLPTGNSIGVSLMYCL